MNRQQVGNRMLAVNDALATYFSGMCCDYRTNQRAGKIFIDPLRAHIRAFLQPLQRAKIGRRGFAADDVVIRDIGELRKNRKSANQKNKIADWQVTESSNQGDR